MEFKNFNKGTSWLLKKIEKKSFLEISNFQKKKKKKKKKKK